MRTRLRSHGLSLRAAAPGPRSVALAVATAVLVALTGPAASGASPDPLVTVTVSGTIENIAIDSNDAADAERENGAMLVEPFVEVAGELFALPEGTAVPGAPTGQDVVVTLVAPPGTAGTEALEQAVDADSSTATRVVEVQPVTEPGAPGSALEGTVADPAAADSVLADPVVADAAVAGTHTLTILPVYWTAPDTDLGSLTTLGTRTADYWREQSAGRLNITTTVKPWAAVAVAGLPGNCDSTTLASLFDAAMAANPSVATPSTTNHVIVYFPHYGTCGFAGRGSVLGGYIWDNGYTLVDVAAHELGHNLGLGHANITTCTSGGARVSLSATCTPTEYGDYADVMGIAMARTTGNLNSALADYLGWANVTAISPSSPAVTVDLSPLAQFTAVRGVKIQVPAGTVYVDFRPATGRDVRMPAWAGVQVHLRTTSSGGTYPATYLLDMQPAAASFASPALTPGFTWVVPDTSLSITVTGIGSTATVRIAPTVVLEQYVNSVYNHLFNRLPDPDGLRTWTSALRAGTPRIAVANAITYSTEYRSGLIRGSYQQFLGREPEPTGLAFWLAQMEQGLTIQQMESGFLASEEYYQQAGANDAAWISRLYGHVLGRSAVPAEVQAWLPHVNYGNRAAVAMGFLLSTERLTTVIDSQYQHLLGRGIDPAGRQSWVAAIQSGVRLEAVIGGIIASEEYFSRC